MVEDPCRGNVGKSSVKFWLLTVDCVFSGWLGATVQGARESLRPRMGGKAAPDQLRPMTAAKACLEQRMYKFVSWLPERGKWIVKRRRLSSSGLHASTQDRAAKLAADALGCTVRSLLL